MNPYLLQRLQKPYEQNNILALRGNPFSFGCGLMNGGLSDELFSILSQIWSYDYMGSAEFEFGALPKSWKSIYDNQKQYILGEVVVTAKRNNYKTTPTTTEKKKASIYYFCKKNDEAELKEWIGKFANEVKHDFNTKEYVGLANSIFDDKLRVIGWHDIHNDFLFFSNKLMFDKMVKVLL